MVITYTSVRCPRWSNEQRNSIDCFVKFNHLVKEVPFTASPSDPEPHGQKIFERCKAGEFGPIAEPVFQTDQTFDNSYPPEPSLRDESGGAEVFFRFIEAANAENATGTVRGIVLVWASMIEDLLGGVLESFMADHELARDLIQEGALANFSNRIKVAFTLGLINGEERATCNSIRKIRNKFAHEWDTSLENEEFKKCILDSMKHIANTYSPDIVFREDLEYLTKIIYAGACGILALRLMKRAEEVSSMKRSVRKEDAPPLPDKEGTNGGEGGIRTPG